MAAGKISLQANDGKVLSLVAPDGMSADSIGTIATLESPVFTGEPIAPVPTSDYQVANKKYVDDNAMNLATVNSYDLGVNQTWQDVTASRASMVTYTNTTGKPIQVGITIGSSSNTSRNFYINGVAVAVAFGYDWADYSTMNFIIPNGATYKADGGYFIPYWFELR